MKRLLTSAAMFLCSLLTFAQFSGSGSGTENDPYLILNPIQLNQIRNFLNKKGVYFKLMADIDLTEFLKEENPNQGWLPIGTYSSPFKGVLDGNGHTISGLWIERSNSSYIGFFGCLSDGIVKDLTLNATSIKGDCYIGLLSGKGGTISNCCFSGAVSGGSFVGGCIGSLGKMSDIKSSVDVEGKGNCVGGICGGDSDIANCIVTNNYVKGNDYVGGICGSYCDIIDCIITNNFVKGNDYVGGICGANGSFKNCSFEGKNIEGVDYVGGICGFYYWKEYDSFRRNQDGIINSCYAHTDINAKDYVGGICGSRSSSSSKDVIGCGYKGNICACNDVGGICGNYTNGVFGDFPIKLINNCFAVGKVIASGDYIGGIVGHFIEDSIGQQLSDCYFNGLISGRDIVGGIVGKAYYSLIIERCYSYASVLGDKNVGGLVASAGSDVIIRRCFANNTRISAAKGNLGRILGDGSIRNVGETGTSDENKASNQTIVIDAGVVREVEDGEKNGTGFSPTSLKLKATYVAMGWDFTNTWEIIETECYPYFKTQTAPPVITSQLISGATTISGKCINGGIVTLEVDDLKLQVVSKNHDFAFTVPPLQAGHEVRLNTKTEDKGYSYFTTEIIQYLGSGTENDPYQVYTAADLTGVYRKGYFKLMNDIDLSSYINQFSPTEGWESIGRDGSETIHFDGNGHKITGLWSNSTRDNTGLFSCFANGTIKNLTVETVNGKQVKGGANTGILIGRLINGYVENCNVNGMVSGETPIGGILGILEGGKIFNCKNNVVLKAAVDNSRVGGVGGSVCGEIKQCVCYGTLDVVGKDSYVGGIAGYLSGNVSQCMSYGTLTATSKGSYTGGIAGLSESGSNVINSYSSAVIKSSLYSAGIVAYNYGVVDMCYAIGNIFSNNYGAGIVGYNDGEGAVVKNCVAMNNKIDVTYESQSEQSGGYGQRIIGGIKNNAPAPEMNNYALKTMQKSVNDIPQKVYDDIMNGAAKTLAQLKSKATYEELGWDFNTVWRIEEGSTYPYQVLSTIVDDPDNPDNPDNPDEQETIVVTDISSLTDAIYAEGAMVQSGSEVTLNIRLKNAQTATAYSFDLQLPESVTLVTNSNGDYQYTLSNRHNEHSETVNYQSGSGVYSFAVLSLQTKEIKGNDGAIWTIKLKVADNVANGDYAIKILNAKYSLSSGSSKVNMPETTSKLTISQYKKGDANNDGDVDIADAVCIVNHVVGLPTPSFVKQAADANGDSDVDIADAVRIVNLVVGKINALSRENGSLSNAAMTRAGDVADAITIDDISVWAGDNCSLTVSLKNSQSTNAYSFDLVLPKGVSIVQDSDGEYMYELSERHNGHLSTLNYIGNNTYSFAILSLQSKEVKGNDGTICTFKLKVADKVKGGKYAVAIKNAKYSLISGASKVKMPEAEANLTIKKPGDANGDGDVTEADVNAVAKHIMGNTPEVFDEEAADVNGDQEINAADIVEIVKIIK